MKALSEFFKTWLKLNFRDPARILLGFLLPVVVLLIFGSVKTFPDAERKTDFTLKLIGFFVILGSIDLMTLVELREKGILRKLHTTPLPVITFLASHILARLVLSLLMGELVFLVAALWWRLPMTHYLLPLTLVLTLGSLVFIAIGDLAVSLAPSSETAFALGPAIMIPLVIFSEIFFKFEKGVFWFITQLMPSTYLIHALEKVAGGANSGAIIVELSILALWALVAMTLAARLFRWD